MFTANKLQRILNCARARERVAVSAREQMEHWDRDQKKIKETKWVRQAKSSKAQIYRNVSNTNWKVRRNSWAFLFQFYITGGFRSPSPGLLLLFTHTHGYQAPKSSSPDLLSTADKGRKCVHEEKARPLFWKSHSEVGKEKKKQAISHGRLRPTSSLKVLKHLQMPTPWSVGGCGEGARRVGGRWWKW